MTYNILCITTQKDGYDPRPNFHQPAPAPTAEVVGNRVRYNGEEYSLKGISKGLCGQATLLQLWDGPGQLLELYTDVPAEGSKETSESLRVMAYGAMENRRRQRS